MTRYVKSGHILYLELHFVLLSIQVSLFLRLQPFSFSFLFFFKRVIGFRMMNSDDKCSEEKSNSIFGTIEQGIV